MVTTRGRKPIVWISLCLFGILLPVFVAADDHGARKRQRERKRDGLKHQPELCVAPVTDPTYRETCGACHFAYQPGLLPSRSWVAILAQLDEHFGDPVDVEPESKATIGRYLLANAAEYSSGECAAKILRSAKGQTPARVTEVPCFIRKHHEVPPDVLKRESIGSLSNCTACHKTAEQGIYDDDQVVISE